MLIKFFFGRMRIEMLLPMIAISVGASLGALFRWGLGIHLNSFFPSIPLGTLAANLLGGLLMGLFMGVIQDRGLFSESSRLAIATGFLGGLTTFSTFSAEAVTLLATQQYLWTAVLVGGHVVGSILMTICGIYIIRIIL